MMGSYQLRGNTIDTIIETQRTMDEILPTVRQIATDYEKIAPGVDFMSKYWYTVLLMISFSAIAGSAVGSWFVLKRLEKK